MPHAGGGHGGGGGGSFHGGGHGGSARPAHMYHGVAYLPYWGPGRTISYIFEPLILCGIFLVVGLLLLISLLFSTPNDEDKMNDYAISKYAEYYQPNSNETYENNIVLVLLTSEKDEKDGYYFSAAVGDNIKATVDYSLTSEHSDYKAALNKYLPRGYVSTLGDTMNQVLTYLNDLNSKYTDPFRETLNAINPYTAHLEVKSSYLSFSETQKEDLMTSLTQFKTNTQMTLSLVIDDMYTVMGKDYGTMIPLILFFILLPAGIMIFCLVRGKKASKTFKEEYAAGKVDKSGKPVQATGQPYQSEINGKSAFDEGDSDYTTHY